MSGFLSKKGRKIVAFGDGQNNDISNLQLRNGHHGNGIVLACRSCGSHDVVAVPIADPAVSGPVYTPDQLLGARYDTPDMTGRVLGFEPLD
jgi:hypothetical protein